MIVTVTPNTAIDKALRLENPLSLGHVQRATEVSNTAGGKGLNAARAIKAAGAEVTATGFIGGFSGAFLAKLLGEDGVAHNFVEADIETRTCINVIDGDKVSTEILEAGEAVDAEATCALALRVAELAREASVVTLNGSLPKGMPKDAYVGMIESIKAAGAACILDTSGESLIAGAKALPTVMKPNEDELQQITGSPCADEQTSLVAAKELHASGVDTVIVSLGAKGAIMVCSEGAFKGQPPAIEVVNPVGAGDTLVGVFAVGMEQGKSRAETLRFALACATANCLTPKTGSFELARAEELASATRVERL